LYHAVFGFSSPDDKIMPHFSIRPQIGPNIAIIFVIRSPCFAPLRSAENRDRFG
jgi:hypothetical protein